jgi:hypothetical protein
MSTFNTLPQPSAVVYAGIKKWMPEITAIKAMAAIWQRAN